MTFVFHKSKQMKARVTLTKLSKTINHSEDNFSSYEQFRGEVFMRQLWFRSQYFRPNLSGWTKFAGLKEMWISCHSVELQPRHWGFESNRSSNERFCGEVVTGQIWFRPNNTCPNNQAARNLLAWTLKKLAMTIKCTRVSLGSNKWFFGEVVTWQIWFRPNHSCLTIPAVRNLLSWIKF